MKLGHRPLLVTASARFLVLHRCRDVLFLGGNVLSDRQANYFRHVEVDYLDYDEVHYFRFGRGEKQLAS